MEDVKYIMVLWPDSQVFMEHPRFEECYLIQAIGDQYQNDCAYFVPEDIYVEVYPPFDILRGQ